MHIAGKLTSVQMGVVIPGLGVETLTIILVTELDGVSILVVGSASPFKMTVVEMKAEMCIFHVFNSVASV